MSSISPAVCRVLGQAGLILAASLGFQQALADLLVAALQPIQTKLAELDANPEIAIRTLEEGAVRARTHAARTMKVVRDRMGLTLSAV